MSFLTAVGSYVPARAVDNAELAHLLGVEAAWIERVSGIEERRFASDEESIVDLAVAAGRTCLTAAGSPTIGFLIVSSGTAERRFPGPAASVAQMLNLGDVPALDVPMPSTGAVFGIALARGLTAQYGSVLVVAAEKMSSVVDLSGTNANAAVLFGDGAGACIISDRSGMARITDAVLASDGTFADALQLGFSGALQLEGRTIIMQASRKIPQSIEQLLQRNDLRPGDVSAYLLHQANQNLIDHVARTLGVPREKFFSNIRRYGNTSSASVLIAAAEWTSAHGFKPGEHVVMSVFGAGLHWGSILLTGL
jgi:3-oxoacyl-[acyl-carrier-protein] synthase-3